MSISVKGLNESFHLDGLGLAMGLYGDGVEVVHVYGSNAALATIGCIWEFGGSDTTYNRLGSAVTLGVSSGHAQDTAAGTGARTVYIAGLDQNWEQQSETVTLKGQTKAETVNKYRRVNHFEVSTAGSGLENAGIVYLYDTSSAITAGVPDTASKVVRVIATGANEDTSCVYTVPAGKTAYLTHSWFSCGTYKEQDLHVNFKVVDYAGIEKMGVKHNGNGAGSAISHIRHEIPLLVEEKTDIIVNGAVGTGPVDIAAGFTVVLMDN